MIRDWFKRSRKPAVGKAPAPASAPRGERPPETDDDRRISVYDAYGRELRVPLAEWRDKVLRPGLDAAHDDADELYRLALRAVRDGLAADVDQASLRLLAIDPLPERSHTLRAIVLLQTDRPAAAEQVLQAAIGRLGRRGTLLVNLAKAREAQGDDAAVEPLLWEALRDDPNLDNGLGWWLARHRERAGDEAARDALLRVAALPGSWRAELWLARDALERGDVDAALARYREVLARGEFGHDALTTVSGDLGNHGQAARIPELLEPVFDPSRHDIHAGFNLLQAYLDLRRRDAGEALLHRLYALQQTPFKAHLDRMAAAFGQLPAATPPVPAQTPPLQMVALDMPIWMYSLRNPDWLFPPRPEVAGRVAVVAFSRHVGDDSHEGPQQEDEGGRATRTVALYLAEALHCWSGHAARALMPVIQGQGPAIFPAGDDASLCRHFGQDASHVVTGDLDDRGQTWHLSLRLWRSDDASLLAEERVETTPDTLGEAVLALEQALLSHLGGARDAPWLPFYARPHAAALQPYLVALGQSLMLTLAANELTPRSGLLAERNLLEWPLNMALHWPAAQVPPLMYLAALAKVHARGSELLDEFRERTLQLLRDTRRHDGVVARLEPLAWKILGMDDTLRQHLEQLAADTDPAYRTWLQRVAGGDGVATP